MKDIDFSRFSEKFIDDAHHLLNELESKLLELEQNPENIELIEAVFRAMHTLKGIGGMFGFHIISEYTHHLETIFDRIREQIIPIDQAIFEITFISVDHIRKLLTDRNLSDPHIAEKHGNLLVQLEKIISNQMEEVCRIEKMPLVHSKSESAGWYIQFICNEDLVKRAVNIEFIFQDLAKLGSYSIFSHSNQLNDGLGQHEEMWGIILNTESGYSEIEEVFMFIPENVKIIRLVDYELQHKGEINQPAFRSISELAGEINGNGTGNLLLKSESEPEPVNPVYKTPRISVGSDKLDKLMYLVSELFTTRSELIMATRATDMPRIRLAVEKVDKLSAQFRKNALSIRLVPLRELTLKFKRLIRDLSKQLEKDINFEIRGDDTELDKNLVDSLGDPMMHLIRNCIDHGIESPEVRRKMNKSETGTISLEAYQSGNYIYIRISDDGKGIDSESVRLKAVEKGIIAPHVQLSEKEVLDLIFLPGFSTAQNLTQVSGRGVGMDVVKRSISDLRGTVEIETEKGKGTTFILKLQQTISIMDTLLVQAGNSFFTIILEEVEVCGLESHHKLTEHHNSHIKFSGELLPFVSLRQVFQLNGTPPETERIIVVSRQNSRYAIVADHIIGQYQAVIKPLDDVLKSKDFLSGASILGDGNIAFMLDTLKLSQYKN